MNAANATFKNTETTQENPAIDVHHPQTSALSLSGKAPQPLLSFSSQGRTLEVHQAQKLSPTLAHHPEETVRALQKLLLTDSPSDSSVICGLIPFDLSQEANLYLCPEPTWSQAEPPLEEEFPEQRFPEQEHTGQESPAQSPYLSSDGYVDHVRYALTAISQAQVEKIVLARQSTHDLDSSLRPEDIDLTILRRLARANPHADIFRVQDHEGNSWLGASPEVLMHSRDSRLHTHPLAGSLPRNENYPTEKSASSFLESSTKNLREHGFVTAHIREHLAPLCHKLDIPKNPSLLSTDSMWHLGTPITGTLNASVSSLEAALAIHPTPAVAGTPQQAALDLIAQLEPDRRQFYSGLVGWMDARGNGRWSLVLRCAKREGHRLTLFAGAGIVQGSDPTEEHLETHAKMRTVLSALKGLV